MTTRHPPTVADAVAALEARFPPETAEDWDNVGLTCGEREAPLRRVLFAVDPLPQVIDEALEWRADLLVTHHPLLLRPVSSVSTDTWKGRALQALIRSECSLFTAHTNADVAVGGVNDALAEALGLLDAVPVRPWPDAPTDKVVTLVPPDAVQKVIDAMTAAMNGAGGGHFVGHGVDVTEQLGEHRVEMRVPRQRRAAVVQALRAAHPHDMVAVDVVELAAAPGNTGLGRVGHLAEPLSLREFADVVASALPVAPGGVRCFGSAAQSVSRVAVCGGAGDSLLPDAARSGADVYVTGDLRHHRVTEHLADGGPALIDPGHWASEWPWLGRAEASLREVLASAGTDATTVETRVSTRRTDAVTEWTSSRA